MKFQGTEFFTAQLLTSNLHTGKYYFAVLNKKGTTLGITPINLTFKKMGIYARKKSISFSAKKKFNLGSVEIRKSTAPDTTLLRCNIPASLCLLAGETFTLKIGSPLVTYS